jgi:enterochelin esterase-like enzyme
MEPKKRSQSLQTRKIPLLSHVSRRDDIDDIVGPGDALHNLLEGELLDHQYRDLERQHSEGIMSIAKHTFL